MTVEVIPGPNRRIPAPGTPEGDRLRDAFYSRMLHRLGDNRLFYVPESSEILTSIDRSRHAAVLTYDTTSPAREYAPQGSGWTIDFDGVADEADTPDVDRLSFGDGAADQGFSVGALIKPDVNNVLMSIISKEESATAEEWTLELDASGNPQLVLTDESASATIGRQDATAIGTDLVLLIATYDGSKASTGIRIYVNAVRLDDTDVEAGTYVAMENTAALTHIGAHYATKAQFFNGLKAFVFVTAKVLNDADVQVIKEDVNSRYDLAL